MFVNNEVNELEYAIEMSEIVLEAGGLLVIKTDSEPLKKLVKKYVFRHSGNVSSDNLSSNIVNWKMISSTNDDSLVFQKN